MGQGEAAAAAVAPERKTEKAVFAKAVDVHDPSLDLGLLWTVDWTKADASAAAAIAKKGGTNEQDRKAAVAAGHGTHYRSIEDGKLDLAEVCPTLHFMGHYNEPPLDLCVDLSSSSTATLDLLLSFDPGLREWAHVENVEDEPLLNAKEYQSLESVREKPRIEKPDSRIGRSHREYCVKGRMKSNELTRKAAEEIVDRMFRESRAKALGTTSGGVVERTAGPWACGG